MKLLIATIAIVAFAGDAFGQNNYRRPRLAAMALPGPPFTTQYAEPLSHRPIIRALPKAVAAVATATSLAPSPINFIGSGVPIAIRALHVVANGSPYRGRPGKTVLWVLFPRLQK